ncbi:MAG: 2-hydroxyacyl-CoA dehydratase [Desulfomonile tiedjei]|uniref:2-hydroxyacyl-CoA dehydratase n=1 Tax=Desulfomonile tiedjei TaxID=2358 RepID=A0A9D6V5J9_9BACT|nr:2-hydroxyacyl-CoA dehydratase [Desulfomonile tiedjei]
MNKSEILNVFQDVVKEPLNSYVEQWISGGGKVGGYYCSLIPAEIFTAAGMVPYRIRGPRSEDTALADVYLSSNVCTFVRHTVNIALQGEFDFMSGIVCMNGCDQARRAYEVWKQKTKVPFHAFLSVPRTSEERLLSWYKEELEKLIEAMEKHFSVKIRSQELHEAIKLHNAARANLIRLNDLRKRPSPPISGSEALTVTIAAHVMPLKNFNELAEVLLAALNSDQAPRKYRARFIVSGGELDEPEFLKVMEDQGGLVVYEDTCFGARFYEEQVPEEGDPLTKIAERYFYRVPCARMVNSFPARYANVEQIMTDFHADGLIAQRIKQCIVNAGHLYNFTRRGRSNGMPTLVLDREYLAGGYGQVKTRVQAFIENIESKSKKGAEL